MEEEVIEGEVTEEGEDEPVTVPAVRSPAVVEELSVEEVGARMEKITQLMKLQMKKDADYGVIPGTEKPSLLKPGAEKLCVMFKLVPRYEREKVWDGDHLTVEASCTLIHAPSKTEWGEGGAMCSTKETRYRWRVSRRKCPSCGNETIIEGKAEFGGGWVCWKKKGGCGAKFQATDPDIVSQEIGQVENPDLPDLWNTIVKMAQKRALIDACLVSTGASVLFTQDVADDEKETDAHPQEEEQAATLKPNVRYPTWQELLAALDKVTLDKVYPSGAILKIAASAEWGIEVKKPKDLDEHSKEAFDRVHRVLYDLAARFDFPPPTRKDVLNAWMVEFPKFKEKAEALFAESGEEFDSPQEPVDSGDDVEADGGQVELPVDSEKTPFG